MSEQIENTEVEKQTDNDTQKSENEKISQPRDENGKFQPLESNKTKESTEPNPKEPVRDSLLDEIEADLTKSLKGKFDPKDLDGLDQRTKIRMLRVLDKSLNKKEAKEVVDPTSPAAPTLPHIETLMEKNRADKYMANIRNKKENSILAFSQAYRGNQ